VSPSGAPAPEAVAELQLALLRSLLSGVPLPGSSEPLRFPDQPFIERAGPTALIDENLAPALAGALQPTDNVRVVRRAELRAPAGSERGTVALRFEPPRVDGGVLWISLAATFLPADGTNELLGLSTAEAGFREVGGAWRLAEGPRFLAS
jgi:hypothetical protein